MYTIEKKKNPRQSQYKLIIFAFVVAMLVFWGSILAFWIRGNYMTGLPPKAIVPVEDPAEGISPDFRLLELSYDAEAVQLVIHFHHRNDVIVNGHFVYLQGHESHMIVFSHLSSGTFELRLDNQRDGHFETLVYEGQVEVIADDAIRLSFPLGFLPNIAEKHINVFSMESRDRMPDEGFAQFGN